MSDKDKERTFAPSAAVASVEELAKDAECAQECAMDHGLHITELKALAGRIRALQSASALTLAPEDVDFLERVAIKFHNALANASTMREQGRKDGYALLIQMQALVRDLKDRATRHTTDRRANNAS